MVKLNEFVKKFDGTILILGLVLIAVLVSGITNAFACVGNDCEPRNIGNVKDCGTGNVGDILVHSGQVEGKDKNDIGIWTDPKSIPELKGEKGDKGDKGDNGLDFDPAEIIRLDNRINSETTNRINTDNMLYTKTQNLADYVDYVSDLNYDEHLEMNTNITNNAKEIKKVDTESKIRDTILTDNLNDEIMTREATDNFLEWSISNTNTALSLETTRAVTAESNLQTNIDTAVGNSKTRDLLLEKSIKTETTNRQTADTILQNNINSEVSRATNAESVLQTNISNVNSNSINRDSVLQNNINAEATTRSNADNNLQNNINITDNNSQIRDNKLQTNINSTNSRIDDVSNRVSKLEATQYIVKTELRFIREKHLEVGVYAEYNAGRNVCSEVGLNVVIPIGNSYLDRENKKINSRLDRLEQKVGGATIIERTLDKKGKVRSISITQGQLAVNGEF
jgi:hypothetical protein